MARPNSIYVDNAATTPLDPRVLKAMKPYFTTFYGNASSINTYGLKTKQALEEARNRVAKFMNANPGQLVFTGSATEANNLILKGFALKMGQAKTHIAISTIEHECVLNSAKWLKEQGYQITFLPVDRYGIIDLGTVELALKRGASLISVIHVNNEIGTIQSLQEIGELCHQYNAFFHTDAAQSFGKIPIDVKEMNIDFMTVNAHKIYGPKGVGALFIQNNKVIEPLLHGGGQEFNLRSSTENVPGIIGFAKAVELRKKEMANEARKLKTLETQLIKGVLNIKDAYLNGHPVKKVPNITNFRFLFIEGEALLLLMNDCGIAASTGSACSSGSDEPSHVLMAIGLKPEEARGSLRISLGKYNTKEDINYIIEAVPSAVKKLRKLSPLSN